MELSFPESKKPQDKMKRSNSLPAIKRYRKKQMHFTTNTIDRKIKMIAALLACKETMDEHQLVSAIRNQLSGTRMEASITYQHIYDSVRRLRLVKTVLFSKSMSMFNSNVDG